jgi:hypothetical protein
LILPNLDKIDESLLTYETSSISGMGATTSQKLARESRLLLSRQRNGVSSSIEIGYTSRFQ